MLKVGVTGGIGSGKSMVCNVLESLGYPVFYSDFEARQLSNHDPDIRKELTHLLGTEAYTEEGINRPFLAKKIFGNAALLQKVNAIIHPRVRQAFDSFAASKNTDLIFNEAAILIETGTHRNFDAMVLVTAPEKVRIERVKQRDQANEAEIKSRMGKQWTDAQKRPYATFEIINDGKTPLLAQIEKMLEVLNKKENV